jgi:hypothetical protein
MDRSSRSEVFPGAPDSTNRAWRVGVGLSTIALVALVVLDIADDSFSNWWVNHVVATAVLIGVVVGFVAGLLLDRRARIRERSRWHFLREQAAMSLSDAAINALRAFGYADVERAGAGLGSHDAAEGSLARLKQAAETFRLRVAEWRSTLKATDDAALLKRCEAYDTAVSDVVLYLDLDQEGDEVSNALEIAGNVLRGQEEYFAKLSQKLTDAQAGRTVAEVSRQVDRYWRYRRSLRRRLQLWKAMRRMANMARRAQRISNEGDTQFGEASDWERDR